MKILFVSQYFPPEMGAPAARVHELAVHWVRRGHEVTVLTGFPNHPAGVLPPEYRPKWRRLLYREQVDGIQVMRVWLMPFPNRKAHERIVNYSSFWLSSSFVGIFVPRPDIVIATSPQLLVGMTGWWLSTIKRVPFVFEVRDLWPESLAAVGASGERSALYNLLGGIAKLLYWACDRVVVVTPAFQNHLIEHWRVEARKIAVVENGVETELFRPGDGTEMRRLLRLEGKFVVSYIGTLGMAHGLATVLDTASRFAADGSDAIFLFAGEGAEKSHLLDLANQRGLSNVIFVGEQPRAAVPDLISASDVCLVPLKKQGVFRTVIPSKLLEIMSCGRPVILGVEGQARKIVEDAQAGLMVEPEDPAALGEAIKVLRSDPALRQRLGNNGRRWIQGYYSREEKASAYLSVLEKIVGTSAVTALDLPVGWH